MSLFVEQEVVCANCEQQGKTYFPNFCFKVNKKNYTVWLCDTCKTYGQIVIDIDKIIRRQK